MFQNRRISLTTERAENYAECFCVFRSRYHAFTHRTHLLVRVLFARQNALVRIIAKRRHRRIGDHNRLEMESSIGDEHYCVSILRVFDHRCRASQNLSRRQRLGLRYRERGIPFRQSRPRLLDRTRELNRPRQDQPRPRFKIVLHRRAQVPDVERNIHKDVQTLHSRHVHRHQARVPVMH